jgi:hypothetical protein
VKQSNPPKTLPDGSIEPAHTIEQVCVSCGYDLDEAELLRTRVLTVVYP